MLYGLSTGEVRRRKEKMGENEESVDASGRGGEVRGQVAQT